MEHDAAKAVLFHAEGLAQRIEAVTQALELGMSLTQIEDYLDWIDATRASAAAQPKTSWLTRFANLLGSGKAWGFPHRTPAPHRTQLAHSQSSLPTKPR